jgi:myosin heavy subunit
MLAEVVAALQTVGFAAEDIDVVRRLAAAVLHVGQIKIGPPAEEHQPVTFDAAATAAIAQVAKLLAIEVAELTRALTTTVYLPRTEKIVRVFNVLQASGAV